MARKLPRNPVQKPLTQIAIDDPLLSEARSRYGKSIGGNSSGEGGAWAQAGAAVMSTELQKLHTERLQKLLTGNLVIELDPEQIDDEVGSDRSNPWLNDPTFHALKASIEANGQDVPIHVAPDPNWTPVFNETEGVILSGVRYRVVSGRRRLAAVKELGRKVRAVCVKIAPDSPTFDQMHRRFRENAERENLSLFDELVAIGEMFSHAKTSGEKLTGRSFAQAIGVAEPKVSRGRAVYDYRDRIMAEVVNPHLLTLHQLDAIIPALRAGASLPTVEGVEMRTSSAPSTSQRPRTQSLPTLLKRTQIIKGRKIVAKSRMGKITLDLGAGANIDEAFLDKLLLFIQAERGR